MYFKAFRVIVVNPKKKPFTADKHYEVLAINKEALTKLLVADDDGELQWLTKDQVRKVPNS